MSYYLKMEGVAVGYNQKPLIKDIDISLEKGRIVTMIGPNGAGKSTIIKSIIRRLSLLGGQVWLDGADMKTISFKDLSVKMAVVLTEHMQPELMTCYDLAATGRYPYTGRLGILSPEDEEKVDEALRLVQADDLGDRYFTEISDGQKQRVLLARAICQEPEIIILDEPTSFLDVRHKIELLSILKGMAREKGITVLMSLHEIDLAMKISDKIICVQGDHIAAFGSPEEIFDHDRIRELYGLSEGSFDSLFGSVELPANRENPSILIMSSGGSGIPLYRKLQREGQSFAAGPLYTNDIDYHLAKNLAAKVFAVEAFADLTWETCREILEYVEKNIKQVILTEIPIGGANRNMLQLLEEIRKAGIPIEGEWPREPLR